MASIIRRLTYFPRITHLARRAGLAPVLRSLYSRWTAPAGILKIRVSDLEISLYAQSPEEVRDLEGTSMSAECPWSERNTLEACLAFLLPGDVIYDIGANYGLYSVALAKKVGEQGQVIAFEPIKRNFERLSANIQLNGVKNIRCFPYALGERAEKGEMYIDEEHPWCSSLLDHRPDGPRTLPVEAVEVVVGDSFRAAHSLPVPRGVKIDVEGFEYSVMRGLQWTLGDKRCAFLACEVHPQYLPAGTTTEDIFRLVTSCGFSRIDRQTRGPEQHILCYKE
jgi:FkbM family methyltransferase